MMYMGSCRLSCNVFISSEWHVNFKQSLNVKKDGCIRLSFKFNQSSEQYNEMNLVLIRVLIFV
jgi:hypothetical protein